MNLARADTFINVYLPRPDGEDPRRHVQAPSPLFGEEKLYKFSDQIQKDRRLFLGKKQMSLYEIYYKDTKGCVTLEKTTNEEDSEPIDEDEFEEHSEDATHMDDERQVELPSINKVSLSLDKQVKRYRKPKMRRFNEPLNAYVSNRKKIQTMTRLELNASIERQITSLDVTPSQRERTLYDYPLKTDTVSIPRIFKKSQSAPLDVRQFRSLGLPPIMLGNNRRTNRAPTASFPASQREDSIKVLPIQPGSKPVWRQNTGILADPSRFSRVPKMRYFRSKPVELSVISSSLFKSA